MPDVDYTNTAQTDLAIIQTLAADLTAISSEFTPAGKLAARLHITHAKDHASVPVLAGTKYTVEVSMQATGNDSWCPVWSCQAGVTLPVAMVTDGTEAVGQTVIECGAALPVVGDVVCFKHATIGSTEFKEVVARVVTGGSETVTLKSALTNEQAQGTYYTQVEMWQPVFDLQGVLRLRVVINNNLGTTNRAIIFRVKLVSCDGIG